MFWEIPIEQVFLSDDGIFDAISRKQRTKSLQFSISKESRHLDKVGTSKEKSFHQIHAEQVQHFV